MRKSILTSVLFLSSAILFAQEKLTNQSVLELKNNGFSEEIIRAKISSATQTDFKISLADLFELKQKGISEETLQAMISKQQDNSSTDLIYLTSLEEVNGNLLLNKKIELKKGDELKVFLPLMGSKDFSYIEPKKSGFSLKNLSKIASAVGTGALAVALGTSFSNSDTFFKAWEVMNKADAVFYGVDALNKVSELAISDKAKKIAGKFFKIKEWNISEGIITGEIEGKKYTVQLREALLTNEIKLK